jgi:hypothetical protein
MKVATICYLLKDGEVLLGMKKKILERGNGTALAER